MWTSSLAKFKCQQLKILHWNAGLWRRGAGGGERVLVVPDLVDTVKPIFEDWHLKGNLNHCAPWLKSSFNSYSVEAKGVLTTARGFRSWCRGGFRELIPGFLGSILLQASLDLYSQEPLLTMDTFLLASAWRKQELKYVFSLIDSVGSAAHNSILHSLCFLTHGVGVVQIWLTKNVNKI